MPIVSPEEGKVKEVGQWLLAHANNRRRDVVLIQEGPAGVSFEVTDDLYEKWIARTGQEHRPLETTATQEVTAPVRRGPGRPRKYPLNNGSN